MASIYKMRRSPFWWIEFMDAGGERQQQSTKLRYQVASETRQARQRCAELTALEAAHKCASGYSGAWAAWVPRFLAQRYGATATGTRAEQAWHNLAAYMESIGVTVPAQLTRQQVRDFIDWRKEARAEAGTRKGAKNTALLEIKFLGLIMDEAVASGFTNKNPCARLGIGRDEPKRKPRITEEEHGFITRALKGEPEWMRVSYKIAWEQGCRFSETLIPLRDVDLARNVVGLRTKGKKERVAEVPLSPRLRPLMRRLMGERPGFLRGMNRSKITNRSEGREYTFEKSAPPKGGAAKAFWKFFRKIGLPHLSFHCCRVTFITRCYEAGLSEPDVMRICPHASTTVHRTYPRLPASGGYLQGQMARLTAHGLGAGRLHQRDAA